MWVRDEETTVLLPLEPLASTVIFTIFRAYAGRVWKIELNSATGIQSATLADLRKIGLI
jgi:hypothetical protein